MAQTTASLMRAAMRKHDISWSELTVTAKRLAAEEIDRDIGRFQGHGPVTINIAAAIITLIVQRDNLGG